MNIRRYHRRFLIMLIFVIASFLMVHYLWNSKETISCFASADTLKKIDELAVLIKDPLKALNLSFFLCYTTLWGALKINGPLPWQDSLDLCILNKEISAVDEGYLARSFKRYGLSIAYNSAGGVYTVTKIGETAPYVTLTVFEEDLVTRQFRRVGWIHRMLPPNSCDELQCFPPDLILKPLPLTMFNNHMMPIPRDGIEIQKYLFPYSWWKEVAPPNCKDV